MTIEQLPDSDLLDNTKQLAAREREILVDILNHLREIENRRLFSDLGYKSLFEYATRELNYSEDQAYRRINAMRMVRTLPIVEGKIETSELSLTNLALVNSLFRQQAKNGSPMSNDCKLEVLNAVIHKSRKDVETIIKEVSGEPLNTKVELKMMANPELLEKIERIKGLMAHSHPGLETAELFERLCDQFLETHKRQLERKTAQSENVASGERPIRVSIKRQVWKKAASQCEKCGSTYGLQIDHIRPAAMGGDNSPSNLRLLCRTCNQREAVKAFGRSTMGSYLKGR